MSDRAFTLILVGAGGNIGSHTVPLLARLPGLRRLVLVDNQRYEAGNLAGQDLLPADVGRPKAEVQAARARAIAPRAEVRAETGDLADLPLGVWQADLVLAALDSRWARQFTNQQAWRWGVPYVDAGVAASDGLARVSVYLPGPDSACLECHWSEQDYRLLEATNPCQPNGRPPSPTNAPACLGALAASLLTWQARRLLQEPESRVGPGRQTLFAANVGQVLNATLPPVADCRFDHRTWTIAPAGLRPEATWDTLLTVAGNRLGTAALTVGLADELWLRPGACQPCGEPLPLHRAGRRGPPASFLCNRCGERIVGCSAMLADEVPATEFTVGERQATLRDTGLRSGDVLRCFAADRRELNLQLGGP